MSNDENVSQTKSNKSRRLLRTIQNRVSFSEAINDGTNGSQPENECETTTTTSSSLPPSTTTSTLKRTTPILFSTTRGLHLRVTSPVVSSTSSSLQRRDRSSHGNVADNGETGAVAADCSDRNSFDSVATNLSRSNASVTTTSATSINSRYNITFCDLERWSTNRANTVSLEDTFTVAHQPSVLPPTAVSGSLASNSLRFLPHNKTNSMRFKGYARFDVE